MMDPGGTARRTGLWRTVATLALVLGLLTPPLSTTGAQAFECPNEEVIHTGDLALTTQSAVDAIAAAPFTTIQGSLSIGGSLIQHLEPLACLRAVRGDLRVENAPGLASLDGLRAVERVGGGLVVRANAKLVQLGMVGLAQVVGDVVIQRNPELKTIEDLGELAEAGSVTLRDNARLPAIAGLDRLHELPDGLFVAGNAALEVVELPALRQAGIGVVVREQLRLRTLALPGLEEIVDGRLRIELNPALEELMLTSLRRLDDGLSFEQNGGVGTLELGKLEVLHRLLWVRDNPNLRAIDLTGLKETQDVYVHLVLNPALEVFEGPGLTDVTRLDLVLDAALPVFALPEVEALDYDLVVGQNDRLEKLELPRLAAVGRHFVIEGNPSLSAVALGDMAAIGADYLVRYNPELRSCPFVELAARLGLRGYSNSSAVANEVEIALNDDTGMAHAIDATSQAALDVHAGVRCVAGDVALHDGAFGDLHALDQLEAIAGQLILGEGAFPERIELQHLRHGGNYLSIGPSHGLLEVSLPALERVSDIWITTEDLRRFAAPSSPG